MKTATPACEYKRLENGVHRIDLMDNKMASADAYLSILDNIIRESTEKGDDIMRILIVISAPQMPSLQYLATRAKQILANYPDRPPFRNVYVFGEGFMANLLQMFVKMVVQRNNDRMNFFTSSKQDEAIEWLLADD